MSMIGKTLGQFECTALIGKGGMGEVYQAKDQKLGRDVAIKVLPEEFAKDTDRVARFQREAKLLASLNHPNIAAIYGLEESDGAHFLVLELIEGDTLADRLKRGAIPVDESLKLALQIAEALEAAHEKGVIHRDLKPANVKVTPDGKVKVLDFGLAKAFAGDSQDLNLSNSPTLSVAATQQGVILGTAGYMSPEQARGENVDKGADIWAFGAVLFEMFTGRQAFTGKTVSDTLASVLAREPEWKSLPPNLHSRIQLLLERCLEKEPKNRYHDIADARVDIQKALADPSGVFVQPVPAGKLRAGFQQMLPWIAAAVVLTAIIAGVIGWILKTPPAPQVVRFDYVLPEDHQLGNLGAALLAVSSDGTQFAYSTNKGIYIRSINEIAARLISGTDEAPGRPFFSPDGQWVGYWSDSDRQLKKIAISGGASVSLTDDPSLGPLYWGVDDKIVYSQGANIVRISANGGTPELLAKVEIEGAEIVFPQVLPDGKSVIFTRLNPAPTTIMAQSLESGESKELFEGDAARYLPTGHLVYWLQNSIYAVPFNPDILEVAGGAVPIVEGVFRVAAPQYAVSDSGTFIYMSRAAEITANRTLVWIDRAGKEELLSASAGAYDNFKISPDGTKVALTITESGNEDIWIWDFALESKTRLTFDEKDEHTPLWSPDGKKIVFASGRVGGRSGIYCKASDGTGEVEQLSSAMNGYLLPACLSGDGNTLVINEFSLIGLQSNIATISMEGDAKKEFLLQEKHNETQVQISPNGQWMAYTSNESGQEEVYVRPFPDVDKGKWQVSQNGGKSPLWSPDGRELFYRNDDAVLAVSVKTETAFNHGKPAAIFQGTHFTPGFDPFDISRWDISPDGKRFLMLREPDTTNNESTARSSLKINVVLNWFEELKQKVPTD